jgi:hypothetical protein
MQVAVVMGHDTVYLPAALHLSRGARHELVGCVISEQFSCK